MARIRLRFLGKVTVRCHSLHDDPCNNARSVRPIATGAPAHHTARVAGPGLFCYRLRYSTWGNLTDVLLGSRPSGQFVTCLNHATDAHTKFREQFFAFAVFDETIGDAQATEVASVPATING